MNIEALKQEYYYNTTSKNVLFSRYLSCFDCCVYFILRNKYNNLKEPFHVFLKDITPYINIDTDNEIERIGFLDFDVDNDYLERITHTGKGIETFKEIETLLDLNQLVMIQTDVRRVPFFRLFQSFDAPIEGANKNGHVFLAISHDKENLYYVEASWNLNKTNFRQYKHNRSVGIIRKEELYPAFNVFLNYITLEIYDNVYNHKYYKENSKIDAIIKNFYKPTEEKDNIKTYYGKHGIQAVIDILKSQPQYLNNINKYYEIELSEILNWKIHEMIHGRIIWQGYIRNLNSINPNTHTQSLLNALTKNLDAWSLLVNTMNMRIKRKLYLIDPTLINFFEEALKSEIELINKFEQYRFHQNN